MKTLTLSLALTIAAFALVTASLCQPAPPVSLKPGCKAPDLTLKASDGKEYDLARFRGVKAVAVCWFPRAGSQGARNQCAALEAAMPQIPRAQRLASCCAQLSAGLRALGPSLGSTSGALRAILAEALLQGPSH